MLFKNLKTPTVGLFLMLFFSSGAAWADVDYWFNGSSLDGWTGQAFGCPGASTTVTNANEGKLTGIINPMSPCGGESGGRIVGPEVTAFGSNVYHIAFNYSYSETFGNNPNLEFQIDAELDTGSVVLWVENLPDSFGNQNHWEVIVGLPSNTMSFNIYMYVDGASSGGTAVVTLDSMQITDGGMSGPYSGVGTGDATLLVHTVDDQIRAQMSGSIESGEHFQLDVSDYFTGLGKKYAGSYHSNPVFFTGMVNWSKDFVHSDVEYTEPDATGDTREKKILDFKFQDVGGSRHQGETQVHLN